MATNVRSRRSYMRWKVYSKRYNPSVGKRCHMHPELPQIRPELSLRDFGQLCEVFVTYLLVLVLFYNLGLVSFTFIITLN